MPDGVFRDAAFSQEQIDLMTSVFEEVIRELGLSQGPKATHDLVATAILECAERDVFDQFEMRKVHTRSYPIITGRLFDLRSAANSKAARTPVCSVFHITPQISRGSKAPLRRREGEEISTFIISTPQTMLAQACIRMGKKAKPSVFSIAGGFAVCRAAPGVHPAKARPSARQRR
jgi:hypothetical protein